MRAPAFSIAMISVHSSPLGKLGTQDTGGMSVYIRELSRQMGRRGHRVDIFTRAADGQTPGEALAISENVRLIPLELGAAAQAPKAALHPHLFGFFREIERFRLQAGAFYGVVHSHYWLSGQVGRQARRAWDIPHITTFHTLGAVKNLVCGHGSEPEVRIAAERDLTGRCERVLVTSARERGNLIHHCHADPDRIALVPCGVDLELFRPLDRGLARRRVGAQPEEGLILYVGRLAPEKGLERLLQAFARLAHIDRLRLIVVGGDGEADPARRRMRELSRRLGIAERVRFSGRIEQAELPFYYNAADVLALSSAYESFGMVALESLACGTPVAATRVGAMEELLREPGSGRLAQDLEPASLAAAIEALLQNRPAPLRAAETIRRSVQRYDWSRVAAEVLEVYAVCLAEAAGTIEDAWAGLGPRSGRTGCCGCGAFLQA